MNRAYLDRREIIGQVLQGKRRERIPRALFGAGLWAYRQTGLRIQDIVRNPLQFAETLAGFFRDLDTDIVFAGSGLNTFPAEAIGGHIAFRGEQAPLLSTPLISKTEDACYFERIDIASSPCTLALVEMIARAVSDCISQISDPHRKYILMPSCDLPPDTPLLNVKEFLACADKVE